MNISELLSAYNYDEKLAEYLELLLKSSIDKNKLLYTGIEEESSFLDCNLLNSTISHASDYGYAVNLGSNQKIVCKDVTSDSEINISKYEIIGSKNSMKVFALDDYIINSTKTLNVIGVVAKELLSKEYTIGSNQYYLFVFDNDISSEYEITRNGEVINPLILTSSSYGLLILNTDKEGNQLFFSGDVIKIRYFKYSDTNLTGVKFDKFETNEVVYEDSVDPESDKQIIYNNTMLYYLTSNRQYSNNNIIYTVMSYFYKKFSAINLEIINKTYNNLYKLNIPGNFNNYDFELLVDGEPSKDDYYIINNKAGDNITVSSFNNISYKLIYDLSEGMIDLSTDAKKQEFLSNVFAVNNILIVKDNSSYQYKLITNNILASFINIEEAPNAYNLKLTGTISGNSLASLAVKDVLVTGTVVYNEYNGNYYTLGKPSSYKYALTPTSNKDYKLKINTSGSSITARYLNDFLKVGDILLINGSYYEVQFFQSKKDDFSSLFFTKVDLYDFRYELSDLYNLYELPDIQIIFGTNKVIKSNDDYFIVKDNESISDDNYRVYIEEFNNYNVATNRINNERLLPYNVYKFSLDTPTFTSLLGTGDIIYNTSDKNYYAVTSVTSTNVYVSDAEAVDNPNLIYELGDLQNSAEGSYFVLPALADLILKNTYEGYNKGSKNTILDLNLSAVLNKGNVVTCGGNNYRIIYSKLANRLSGNYLSAATAPYNETTGSCTGSVFVRYQLTHSANNTGITYASRNFTTEKYIKNSSTYYKVLGFDEKYVYFEAAGSVSPTDEQIINLSISSYVDDGKIPISAIKKLIFKANNKFRIKDLVRHSTAGSGKMVMSVSAITNPASTNDESMTLIYTFNNGTETPTQDNYIGYISSKSTVASTATHNTTKADYKFFTTFSDLFLELFGYMSDIFNYTDFMVRTFVTNTGTSTTKVATFYSLGLKLSTSTTTASYVGKTTIKLPQINDKVPKYEATYAAGSAANDSHRFIAVNWDSLPYLTRTEYVKIRSTPAKSYNLAVDPNLDYDVSAELQNGVRVSSASTTTYDVKVPENNVTANYLELLSTEEIYAQNKVIYDGTDYYKVITEIDPENNRVELSKITTTPYDLKVAAGSISVDSSSGTDRYFIQISNLNTIFDIGKIVYNGYNYFRIEEEYTKDEVGNKSFTSDDHTPLKLGSTLYFNSKNYLINNIELNTSIIITSNYYDYDFRYSLISINNYNDLPTLGSLLRAGSIIHNKSDDKYYSIVSISDKIEVTEVDEQEYSVSYEFGDSAPFEIPSIKDIVKTDAIFYNTSNHNYYRVTSVVNNSYSISLIENYTYIFDVSNYYINENVYRAPNTYNILGGANPLISEGDIVYYDEFYRFNRKEVVSTLLGNEYSKIYYYPILYLASGNFEIINNVINIRDSLQDLLSAGSIILNMYDNKKYLVRANDYGEGGSNKLLYVEELDPIQGDAKVDVRFDFGEVSNGIINYRTITEDNFYKKNDVIRVNNFTIYNYDSIHPVISPIISSGKYPYQKYIKYKNPNGSENINYTLTSEDKIYNLISKYEAETRIQYYIIYYKLNPGFEFSIEDYINFLRNTVNPYDTNNIIYKFIPASSKIIDLPIRVVHHTTDNEIKNLVNKIISSVSSTIGSTINLYSIISKINKLSEVDSVIFINPVEQYQELTANQYLVIREESIKYEYSGT